MRSTLASATVRRVSSAAAGHPCVPGGSARPLYHTQLLVQGRSRMTPHDSHTRPPHTHDPLTHMTRLSKVGCARAHRRRPLHAHRVSLNTSHLMSDVVSLCSGDQLSHPIAGLAPGRFAVSARSVSRVRWT